MGVILSFPSSRQRCVEREDLGNWITLAAATRPTLKLLQLLTVSS
jgi:hypothetical protein